MDSLTEAETRFKRQRMHVGTTQDREVSAFVEGAEWARKEALLEAAAKMPDDIHDPRHMADWLRALTEGDS